MFRPFFIRIDLPYSVKRGEKLALQLIVFNYGDTDQTVSHFNLAIFFMNTFLTFFKVTVTLDHDLQSGFEFIEKTGETKDKRNKIDKSLNTRLVKVRTLETILEIINLALTVIFIDSCQWRYGYCILSNSTN